MKEAAQCATNLCEGSSTVRNKLMLIPWILENQPKWQKNDFVSGGHSQAGSLGGLWTGWIGPATVQISGCGLDGALSWWCDKLRLIVVILRLSVVSRGRAIGLLATKGNPPPDCSGQGEGRSFLVLSLASRAVAATPSFQTCLRAYIYTICMCVCIHVYMCMCVDISGANNPTLGRPQSN